VNSASCRSLSIPVNTVRGILDLKGPVRIREEELIPPNQLPVIVFVRAGLTGDDEMLTMLVLGNSLCPLRTVLVVGIVGILAIQRCSGLVDLVSFVAEENDVSSGRGSVPWCCSTNLEVVIWHGSGIDRLRVGCHLWHIN
jgi:hypothetical protein